MLEPDEATASRALSARGSDLAADRPDIGLSAKELCRPFLKLKRLVRYLHTRRQHVYEQTWCDTPISPSDEMFEVYVDTNFAGCGQTRQSTSGGTILYHGNCVTHWSVTQSTLSLSSGESILHGISKGVSTASEMQSAARDFGFETQVRVHSDASAAIGIARHRGLG